MLLIVIASDDLASDGLASDDVSSGALLQTRFFRRNSSDAFFRRSSSRCFSSDAFFQML